MGAVCYAYECKYSALHVKWCVFHLADCYLNPFRVAVNGWGRALAS